MPGRRRLSSPSRRRDGGPGRAQGVSRRPYRLTRVGEAIASLSAGSASRASLMTATASKVTFPINASSAVKV